jgi:two-component system, sensor histidine kinase and response regulator
MSEPAAPETVVVIDDDYAIRLSCRKILLKMGLRVETHEDGARGLEGVAALKPDLVVVDLKMPGMSGMEVVARVHEIDPQVVVAVITGYATIDTAVQAMQSGAYDFLPKPFSPDELRLIVNRGLERRRLALAAQRHEVEQTMLKRRFVTFVSHQLRTPLAAIHQYLDVLNHLDEKADNPARRKEWMGRCLTRIEELQSLIADWLTLARVEGGTMIKERIRVDLGGIVRDILNSYEALAAAESVSLEAQLPETPLAVCGDRNCLSVVLDNLITNAIKYNRPGGRVTVSGTVSGGETVVSVADTGVGIPAKHLPYLFDEFFRVKDEAAKQTTGTGLGLHIARKIVSEMGGAIEVQSEPGSGTTFRVRIPAWQTETANGSESDAGCEAHTHGR